MAHDNPTLNVGFDAHQLEKKLLHGMLYGMGASEAAKAFGALGTAFKNAGAKLKDLHVGYGINAGEVGKSLLYQGAHTQTLSGKAVTSGFIDFDNSATLDALTLTYPPPGAGAQKKGHHKFTYVKPKNEGKKPVLLPGLAVNAPAPPSPPRWFMVMASNTTPAGWGKHAFHHYELMGSRVYAVYGKPNGPRRAVNCTPDTLMDLTYGGFLLEYTP